MRPRCERSASGAAGHVQVLRVPRQVCDGTWHGRGFQAFRVCAEDAMSRHGLVIPLADGQEVHF